MPVDVYSLIAAPDDLVTLALVAASVIGLVFLMALWRAMHSRREPVRAYEREQRAMASFRRTLSGSAYLNATRDRS